MEGRCHLLRRRATWLDSDGDGDGDLAGLTRRLDYLSALGISTLWMMPFYPSPLGDDGYDITDYYSSGCRVSGFDSLPFMIETVGTGAREQPVSYLRSQVEFMERRRGDAIFLGEANVSPQEQERYFAFDDGDGVQMLFDFRTCAARWLAHARGHAGPLVNSLNQRPRIPEHAQFANFVCHHDELSLGMLSDAERGEVFGAFAPEPGHRVYGRGGGTHRSGSRSARSRAIAARAVGSVSRSHPKSSLVSRSSSPGPALTTVARRV